MAFKALTANRNTVIWALLSAKSTLPSTTNPTNPMNPTNPTNPTNPVKRWVMDGCVAELAKSLEDNSTQAIFVHPVAGSLSAACLPRPAKLPHLRQTKLGGK
ncbi:hypothetical protein GGR50DRAFT_693241 [Xylaria sp. CBS 124048]|nr:hypothetical protein GGR50DRAFT_693241 [Xylaria sp. CBS 124048]